MRTVYRDPASRWITSDDADPKAGGMSHEFNVLDIFHEGGGSDHTTYVGSVKFQHGSMLEVGVNGLQHADLYRILIDRLQSVQAGAFSCPENDEQIAHLQAALALDEERTARRKAARSEGMMRGN